jgi:N-acetylmuramic acid 6-phosphate etherase
VESALDCARLAAARLATAAWGWDEPTLDGSGTALTESINPRTAGLDQLSTLEMLRRINAEDTRVPRAVARALPQIAEAVERVTERMRQGGRLIYVGAGTSGRLGVLDASEIPPTYGMEAERVMAVIAGGEQAIRYAVEGAEDDAQAGAQALADLAVNDLDSVVGIAASGRTPYVLGALAEAQHRGALSISIACNSPAPVEEQADIRIALLVGPEAITGSTRMKAGTAQKLALNLLSTGVMVRLGKTFGNWMVDLRATNQKLRVRARWIVAQVCELDEAAAAAALEAANGEVKTAIVATLARISAQEARQRLAGSGGMVRAALGEFNSQ